jgi:hypothetical protein
LHVSLICVSNLTLLADWLEDYGAMWIDWKTMIVKFQHNGKDVVLHGVVDDTSTCPSVSSHGLKGLLKRSALSHYMKLMPILVDPKNSIEHVLVVEQKDIPA